MADPFLSNFLKLWKGGYYEGDPRAPLGESRYGMFGYHSSHYLVYLCCIKPYIKSDTVVIEIGPGRGAWTKAILGSNPRHIYAVDAVPPEHSGFWDYVGRKENIDYVVVDDFSLSKIPDNSADYFFSFGCFCHLRPEMCVDYINSLSKKMKPGAHGFLMIADYDKFNVCMQQYRETSIDKVFSGPKYMLVRAALRLTLKLSPRKFFFSELKKSNDNGPTVPGAWYHFGVDRACEAITEAGFTVVEQDMGVNHRDPLIHFVKE